VLLQIVQGRAVLTNRYSVSVVVPALVFSLVMALSASPATATPRPRVTLTLPRQADQGARIGYSFTVARVPKGATVVIQRQMGTSHRYVTVAKVTGPARTGSFSPLSLGSYMLRIAVRDRHAKILASQNRRLLVFGNVTFGTLLGGDGGVYTTPTATFPWARSYYNGEVNYTAFTIARTTCRSVHVDFVPGTDSGSENLGSQQGVATLVQESRDPVVAAVVAQNTGHLDAGTTLGQSWSLNLSQPPGGGSRLFTWYVNGVASCYSNAVE
jgi:hypothetical protein